MDFRVKQFSKLPGLPNPEPGLRRIVERAPQAEAWADQTMERARPTLTMLYGIRRRLATGAVVLLSGWLFVHVMFGANGMVVYRQKKTDYQNLQKEIGALTDENTRYTEQINALQTDPEAIVKEAREQLRYLRPGEVVYVSPTPAAPPRPEKNSAHR
jgi:cell division protein FtsB